MKIAFLGDIALFGCFDIKQNKNLKDNLKEICNYLEDFDLIIGNLESPFSISKHTCGAKSAYVYSDIYNAEILKWLHINAVNIANNHIFDYGDEGYLTTKNILNKLGISYFGTEGNTWAYESKDVKLLFSGYCCYSTNPLKIANTQGGYGINPFNVADIIKHLKYAHSRGYFVILSSHAGVEHVNYPAIDHIRAARKFADICPYFYYGHHPHVIQGVEEYKDSLIAHSLGNFCFDDVYTDTSGDKPLVTLTEQNRTGMILELTIEANKVVAWKETPINIGKDGRISILKDSDFLEAYNDRLKHCEEQSLDYISNRQYVINARLAERKAKRDLSWVMKRLRPRFIQLIFSMMNNKRLYNQNVKKYI